MESHGGRDSPKEKNAEKISLSGLRRYQRQGLGEEGESRRSERSVDAIMSWSWS